MEVTLALMCSATCDPYYALLPLVHLICVFVQRGNPEERVAGGKNETHATHETSAGLSQNGNRLKAATSVCNMHITFPHQLINKEFEAKTLNKSF